MEEGSTSLDARSTNLYNYQSFSVESTKISLLPSVIQKSKTSSTSLTSNSTFVASGGIAENGLHAWIITYSNDSKSTTSALHLYCIKKDSNSSLNNKKATFQFKEDDGKDLFILTAATIVWNNIDCLIVSLAKQSDKFGFQGELRLISISNTSNIHNTIIQFGSTLRTIDIPAAATSVLPLNLSHRNRNQTDDMENDEKPALHKFSNPVVLGTKGGCLYILDVHFSLTSLRETVKKSRRTQLVNFADFNRQAFDMIHNGNIHPLVSMDYPYHKDGFLQYEMKSGVFSLDEKVIGVTCLHYIPQIEALAVGYSFGGFQLWSLDAPIGNSNAPKLFYSYPVDELKEKSISFTLNNKSPISHILYQQLSDDNTFGYLWVIRDSGNYLPMMQSNQSPGVMTLYQLQFRSDSTVHDDKHVTRLEAVSKQITRYLHDKLPSRVVHCGVIRDDRELIQGKQSTDSSITQIGLNRSLFIWENISNSGFELKMELFDLHLTMVTDLAKINDKSSLFQNFNISGIGSGLESLKAAWIDEDSIIDEIEVLPISEMDSHDRTTTSPSFEAHFLFESSASISRFFNTQQRAIDKLAMEGPFLLSKIEEAVSTCRAINPTAPTAKNLKQAHELLFQTVLDNINQEKPSSEISDPTLKYLIPTQRLAILLEWSIHQYEEINKFFLRNYNTLLEIGGYVDRQKFLRHFDLVLVRLADLINIFQALLNRDDSTKESIESLFRRLNEIQLTAQLVETVHWFLNNRVLPLRNKSLLGQLSDILDKRRTDRINSSKNSFEDKNVLFIDSLIDGLNIESKSTLGSYPPNKLATLFGLLKSGSPDFVIKKRSIIYYLLLDIKNIDSSTVNDKEIDSFCKTFAIPENTQKFIEALQLLDSAWSDKINQESKLENACNLLIDPTVELDWIARIARNFFEFSAFSLALRFIRATESSVQFTELEDVLIRLQILLHNGLLHEAFGYQRNFQDQEFGETLQLSFYDFCMSTKNISFLLQLPLNENEEKQVVQYLRSRRDLDFLIIYYLQRSRPHEAMIVYDQLLKIPMERNYNIANIGAILQNYKLTMPAIGAPTINIQIPETMEVEKESPKKIEKEEMKKSESFLFPEVPKTPLPQQIVSQSLPSPIFSQDSYKSQSKQNFQSPIAVSTPQQPLTSPKAPKISQEEEQQKAATLVNLETLSGSLNLPPMNATTPEPPMRKSSRLSKRISTSSGGLTNSNSALTSDQIEFQSITSQVTPKEKKARKKELTDSAQRRHRMQLRERTPVTK